MTLGYLTVSIVILLSSIAWLILYFNGIYEAIEDQNEDKKESRPTVPLSSVLLNRIVLSTLERKLRMTKLSKYGFSYWCL